MEESYAPDLLLERYDCDDFEKLPNRDVYLPRRCVHGTYHGMVNVGVYYKEPVLVTTSQVSKISTERASDELFKLSHLLVPGTRVYDDSGPQQRAYTIEEDGSWGEQ